MRAKDRDDRPQIPPGTRVKNILPRENPLYDPAHLRNTQAHGAIRLGEHLPWVKTQQVSTHWIRHTILTWVERRFGFAVAQAYAGHQDASRGARAMSSTGTYVRAGLPEVATALAVLTGEPHPLAPEGASADTNSSSNST